jgi:WD40 repeat protein
MQMDEHTDWVNQLIYLENTEAVVSCSNDTTIKLWMLPFTGGNILPELPQSEISDAAGAGLSAGGPAGGASPLRVNSFYTIDSHQDYVRAMAYAKEPGRLFSVSDDGQLMIHDLAEQGMVAEYNTLRGKYPQFGSQYVPVFKGASPSRQPGAFVVDHSDFTVSSESCPTCIAASESGNVILVGYSDDSIILQDIRTQY